MPRSRLIVVAGLIWLAPQQILVQERPAHARHGAGALEFPGGKVEIGEDPVVALMRELREECGEAASTWSIGPIAEVVHHIYESPGPEVILLLYHVAAFTVRDVSSELMPLEGARLAGHTIADLDETQFLAADRPLVGKIRNGEVRCPFAGLAS